MPPGVGDTRHAGVAYHRHVVAALKGFDEFWNLAPLVLVVVARHPTGHPEVLQKPSGAARVLSGNERNASEHRAHPLGDISEMTNGRSNEKEPTGHRRRSVPIPQPVEVERKVPTSVRSEQPGRRLPPCGRQCHLEIIFWSRLASALSTVARVSH